MKKTIAVLAGAWACALPLSWACAQGTESYPDHPVRIIEPHSPGALVDTVTRYIAQNLAQKWGQPVVVENKPGANQAIGAELVAKSAPDGYTLLVGTQTGLVFNAIARKDLPFDPVKDFAPITGLFDTPFYFVANPKLPVKNVKELIELARSKPGKLTYASIGIGSSHQLAAEMFKTMTGTDILHVAYKGSGPAMTDVLSGQVDMMFEGGGSSLPNVRSGKLRALASTGLHRTEDMPDLPTLAETVPGYNLSVWIGMVAPAGTPKAIIDKINRDTVEILKRPETHKHFAGVGIEMMPTTTDELGRLLKDEFPKWTKVMRDAGIEPQ